MKNSTCILRLWILALIGFYSYTSVNAQTVDTTGLFTAIKAGSTDTILHATIMFYDVDTDGNYDASFTLSAGPIAGWGDYSASIAFYDEGFKVRDGGGFTNTNNITFTAGTTVEIWMDVDVPALNYSTWIRTEGMTYPALIHPDAGFRRTDIDSICRWSALHNPSGEPDSIGAINVDFASSIPGLDVSSLADLTIDVGTLDTAFNTANTVYAALVPYGTTTVNVTATPTILGSYVSGDGAIDVSSGSGTADVEVISYDKSDTTTYTINFTVLGEAHLVDLSTSVGTLDPVFHSDTLSYALSVPYGTASVTISATPNDPNATVTGDSTISLSGIDTVDVVVTAEDGKTTKTYTIVITVLSPNDNATLSALTVDAGQLNPAFDPSGYTYTDTLPKGTTSVTVTATPSDANATVTGAGVIDVSSGSATATIVVTAEDGTTTLTYTVNFIVGTSAVNDVDNSFVQVYPTVTSDNFVVKFSGVPGKITVYNLTGQIESQVNATSLTETVSLDKAGIYIVRIQSEGVIKIVKITKVD